MAVNAAGTAGRRMPAAVAVLRMGRKREREAREEYRQERASHGRARVTGHRSRPSPKPTLAGSGLRVARDPG
jgi:hypothetical protein